MQTAQHSHPCQGASGGMGPPPLQPRPCWPPRGHFSGHGACFCPAGPCVPLVLHSGGFMKKRLVPQGVLAHLLRRWHGLPFWTRDTILVHSNPLGLACRSGSAAEVHQQPFSCLSACLGFHETKNACFSFLPSEILRSGLNFQSPKALCFEKDQLWNPKLHFPSSEVRGLSVSSWAIWTSFPVNCLYPLPSFCLLGWLFKKVNL